VEIKLKLSFPKNNLKNKKRIITKTGPANA